MFKLTFRSVTSVLNNPLVCAQTVLILVACGKSITPKRPETGGTVGGDVYTTLCKRLVASTENGPISPDASGKCKEEFPVPQVTVRPEVLPRGAPGELPPAATVVQPPTNAFESFINNKPLIIAALNSLFPDIMTEDAANPPAQIRFLTALNDFAVALQPLYADPADHDYPRLLPDLGVELSASFKEFSKSAEGKKALVALLKRTDSVGTEGYRELLMATAGYPRLTILLNAIYSLPQGEKVLLRLVQGVTSGAISETNLLASFGLDKKENLKSLFANVHSLMAPQQSGGKSVFLAFLNGMIPYGGELLSVSEKIKFADRSVDFSHTAFQTAGASIVSALNSVMPVLSSGDAYRFSTSLEAVISENPNLSARVLNNVISVIGLTTDPARPEFSRAALAPNSTFMDELSWVLNKLSKVPVNVRTGKTLLSEVVEFAAEPQFVTLMQSLSKQMTYKDKVNYNPANVKNYVELDPLLATQNQSANPAAPLAPFLKVVRSVPPSDNDANNRSAWQRNIALISDADGSRLCSKSNGVLPIRIGEGAAAFRWDYRNRDECALFKIENLSRFYLDSMVGRAQLKLNDGFVSFLLGTAGLVGLTTDDILQSSSGIQGFSLSPSPRALNRFIFFGADSPRYFAGTRPPDIDPSAQLGQANEQANLFMSQLVEPLAVKTCPRATPLSGNVCENFSDTLRGKYSSSIFHWENDRFYESVRPLLEVFYTYNEPDLFLELIGVLNKHWPSVQASGVSGVVAFEPLLAEVFASDAITSLHELAKVLKTKPLRNIDGRTETALTVFSRLVPKLLDAKVTTPLIDALKSGNDRFTRTIGAEGSDADFAWRQARQAVIRAFVPIEGAGVQSHFTDESTPKKLIDGLNWFQKTLATKCPDIADAFSGFCAPAVAEANTFIKDVLGSALLGEAVQLIIDTRAKPAVLGEIELFLKNFVSPEHRDGTAADVADVVLVSNQEVYAGFVKNVARSAFIPSSPTSKTLVENGLNFLKLMTKSPSRYDTHGIFDKILVNLVTPVKDPIAKNKSPLKIFGSVVADVNRVDPSRAALPIDEKDTEAIAKTLGDFFDPNSPRGLEQLFDVVRGRRR